MPKHAPAAAAVSGHAGEIAPDSCRKEEMWKHMGHASAVPAVSGHAGEIAPDSCHKQELWKHMGHASAVPAVSGHASEIALDFGAFAIASASPVPPQQGP